MLTKSDGAWSPTLEIDIFRMDKAQLADYIAAHFLGWEFKNFGSIKFLPDSARIHNNPRSEGNDFTRTLGFLFGYASNPQHAAQFHKGSKSRRPDDYAALMPKPYETYIDPAFRDRIEEIVVSYVTEALHGKDVLARHGNTPQTPWLNRDTYPMAKKYLQEYRLNILQGCVNLATGILMYYCGSNKPTKDSGRIEREAKDGIHPNKSMLDLLHRLKEHRVWCKELSFKEFASYFSQFKKLYLSTSNPG